MLFALHFLSREEGDDKDYHLLCFDWLSPDKKIRLFAPFFNALPDRYAKPVFSWDNRSIYSLLSDEYDCQSLGEALVPAIEGLWLDAKRAAKIAPEPIRFGSWLDMFYGRALFMAGNHGARISITLTEDGVQYVFQRGDQTATYEVDLTLVMRPSIDEACDAVLNILAPFGKQVE